MRPSGADGEVAVIWRAVASTICTVGKSNVFLARHAMSLSKIKPHYANFSSILIKPKAQSLLLHHNFTTFYCFLGKFS